MKIFDYFKKKKQTIPVQEPKPAYLRIPNEEVEQSILEGEIEKFFPESGSWSQSCYKKPTELSKYYIPCHTNDNNWMARLLESKLLDKGILIPFPNIEEFLNNSERFKELKHDYELRIVEWQIGWMADGGGNWLMPEGYGEISLLISPNVDRMFRGGVVKTLMAIGLDREVIEEGIEKNASRWRDQYMKLSFQHEYEPVLYGRDPIKPADPKHKENWLQLRRYKYYQEHKDSVDKYGSLFPEMFMSEEEANELSVILDTQNAERKKIVEAWERSSNSTM